VKFTLIGPAYPLRGGIAHHVYWLRKELSRRGHTVQTISFKKLYPKLLFPGRTTIDSSNLKLDSSALALLDPLRPATCFRAARAIRDFAPEAVIIEWWNPFFSPCLGTLARLIRQPGTICLMECHNVLPHEKSFIDLPLLSYAFSPADFFITHSSKDRADLEQIVAGKRSGVAPLPEVSEFTGRTDSDRGGNNILFFGIVRKYKGLDVLLAAFAKVLTQIDCNLTVAGEFYESVERYLSLARQLGIEDRVRIDDRYIPNEEVPSFMAEADVLVLPYLSATQSGVARIALSNALPIIASKTGGLREVVREGVNGLLFEPGDADALADAIVRYFTERMGPRFAASISESNSYPHGAEIADLIEEAATEEAISNREAR